MQQAPQIDDRERVRTVNDQVWDMVLHLVNPVFFYVLFHVLMVSHLGAQPLFREYEWWIFGAQFFGAWSVFYGTLLRDMGHACRPAFILAALSLVGAITQYVVFRNPDRAAGWAVMTFMGVQLVPGIVLWPVVMTTWWRLKREWTARQAATEGGDGALR